MKNIKPIHFIYLMLLGLFTAAIVSCEGVTATVDSAVESAVEGANSAVDKASSAAASAVDDIKAGAEAIIEDQAIHVIERSENYLDYAHFGHYDLAHYKLKNSSDDTAGDAETKTEIYVSESDHLSIEIVETDMGDRGYSHTQTIKDDEGKVVKKRIFSFETEPELKLVEEIHDIESGHLWSREHKMDQHFAKSNKKPDGIPHHIAFTDKPI